MTKFSRRQFIITSGAATAGSLLAHGCSSGPTNTYPAVAMSRNAAFNVAAAAQTAVGAASRSGRGFPHTLPVVGMQNVRM